jgi:hypothetical protein
MNPYVVVAVGVAWAGSLVGVGYWQNTAGHTAERVEWQARDNEQLRLANERIVTLQDAARATERLHATRLATVSTTYQKELQNAKAQRERDVAAARAGAIRLQYTPDSERPGGSEAGAVTTGTGRCDGSARGELPRETTADLLALVDDADEVVRQLTACQAVVRSDRGE